MKKYIKKIWPLGLTNIILIVFMLVLNIVTLTMLDNVAEQFFGSTPSYLLGSTQGQNVNYVESSFDSVEELYQYEMDKCAEIAQDGLTLLKNDDNLLPLSTDTTLSLFSHSSVDLISGGSGSGSGSFELTANLKEGLENSGFKVNQKLWDFYESGNGSSYKRGIGVINYGQALDWSINECPLNVILQDSELVDSFKNTTAMFVLSRTGGEGGDEARDMLAYGGESGEHYLQPNKEELEIINYLNENFDDIIILVNCNNAMELDWVNDYENIKSVINFPGAGRYGTYGLGYVLRGYDKNNNQISPSGHLVDTLVYDNFSSPAMQNMGDYMYNNTKYYYVVYSEGIYVGYKYYETRYEDYVLERENTGEYDYKNTVTYPFGYGMSYTSFEWSNYSVSTPNENGEIEVTIDVKNVGNYSGRDVVQIYFQSPYTDYDIQNKIEKASVSLVGFEKTKVLEPNESQTVKITVNLKDMITYDSNNQKTYILEDGTYYITAATDAHAAVNNILKTKSQSGINVNLNKLVKSPSELEAGNTNLVKTYVQTNFDSTTYSTLNGVKIENQFDDAIESDMKQLTRSNWLMMENNGLRYGIVSQNKSDAEINGLQFTHDITDELKQKLDSTSSLNPNEGKEYLDVQLGQRNGIDLIDLRGVDYNDPMWNLLLSQLTVEELHKLVTESGYCTPLASSINKPKVRDLDGPAGLNKVVGHGSVEIGNGYYSMTWPTEYILACTWDKNLAREVGELIGEDGLYGDVQGWYGPGMNIHRTPFAGRNFEYYSEDAYLSGIFALMQVSGASSKGMYAFVKHFALNDQETHRDHLGLVTWCNEQAIREIYLKPFEMTIVDYYSEVSYNKPVYDENMNIIDYTYETTSLPATFGVMTSFNRIGATWAGGHYRLITNVLRNEWGYNGFVLTDYEVTSYMHTHQALAAGGDAKLTTVDWGGFSLKDNPEYLKYAYDAAHHILYTVVNSSGMNGFIHGVIYVNGFAYYKIMLIVADIALLTAITIISVKMVKKIKKYRKEQEV